MITNETLETIKQRRSVRSYKSEQIADDELQAILEAGLHAPNAGGQAWHFTAVQNRAMLRKLNDAAKRATLQLGIEPLRALGTNAEYDCLYGAPTLIIVSGDEQAPMPLDGDCAAATQNLLLAAQSLGLGSCWIFFVTLAFLSSQNAELRNELRIPDGYRPYYAAVIGYRNSTEVSVRHRKPNLITYIK